MAAPNLPVEVWVMIALIAALTVTLCLAVLASLHGHLVKVRKLSEEVRALRQAYDAAFSSVEYVDAALDPPPGAGANEKPAKKAA
jgi:hypothetical protein